MARNACTPNPDGAPGRFALPALSASYFMMGVCTLSVVGLLGPISRSFDVSPSKIALLVTAFALTYAVTAPLMQVLIGDWERRRMIEIGLITMAAGAAMAAISTGWWEMITARILMAVGGGLVGPMSSATGAAIVPPERRGAALSIVFAGMPAATVLGVPMSAWLGDVLGWRPVMGLVAALALAVLAAVRRTVPASPGGQRPLPRALLGTVEDRVLGPAVGVTFLQMAALFATYSLIPEFLARDFGVARSLMPFALAAYGIGGILGNILAGRFVQALGSERLIILSLLSLLAVFMGFLTVPSIPSIALVLTFLWGMAGMMMIAPQQARLVRLAPDTANLLLALNGSALYFGIASGSALASQLAGQYGVVALPAASAGLAGLAILSLQVSCKAQRSRQQQPAARVEAGYDCC